LGVLELDLELVCVQLVMLGSVMVQTLVETHSNRLLITLLLASGNIRHQLCIVHLALVHLHLGMD